MASGSAIALCVATVVWAARIGGAPSGSSPAKVLNLHWTAPSACPSAEQLRAQVATYAPLSSERLDVDATVSQTESGYLLDMVIWSDAGSARTLVEHDDCAALSDAAAIKVALALNPYDALDTAEPGKPAHPAKSEACPESRVAAAPAPVCPPVGVTPAVARPRRTIAVGASSAVDWGTLPGVGPMFEASFAWIGRPRFRAAMSTAYWMGREFWRLDEPSVGGHLNALGGTVQACFVLHSGRLEFPICAGAEASAIRSRGLGESRGVSTRSFRFAVAASPQLIWSPHGRLGVWLSPTLAVPVSRYRIEAGPPATTYTARSVSARVALGVEVRLGQ